MNKIILTLTTLFFALFLSGCYHAQVTTGLEPSSQVHEESFANGWVYGLVPPSTVRAQEQCNSGVARVETKLSFLNMLVGNLTLGIYTPMHIKVTCATSSASVIHENTNTIKLNRADSEEEFQKAFMDAADKAVEMKSPVYVVME